MKRFVDQAIVLSRTNYCERDRVVSLLTASHGKITVFAKGVRSEKSRMAAGVELHTLSEVSFMNGKTDLKTLTGARLVTHYGNIVQDLGRTQQSFQALKIINKICEDGTGQEYLDLVATYFAALNDKTYDGAIAELWFSLWLLKMTGTLPEDELQANSEINTYEFDHDTMQFYPRADGQYSLNDIKLLRLLTTHTRPVKLSKPTGSEANLLRLAKLLLKTNLTEV